MSLSKTIVLSAVNLMLGSIAYAQPSESATVFGSVSKNHGAWASNYTTGKHDVKTDAKNDSGSIGAYVWSGVAAGVGDFDNKAEAVEVGNALALTFWGDNYCMAQSQGMEMCLETRSTGDAVAAWTENSTYSELDSVVTIGGSIDFDLEVEASMGGAFNKGYLKTEIQSNIAQLHGRSIEMYYDPLVVGWNVYHDGVYVETTRSFGHSSRTLSMSYVPPGTVFHLESVVELEAWWDRGYIEGSYHANITSN